MEKEEIGMGRPKFTKNHLQQTRSHTRSFGNKYGMAIIKWNGEHTYISGNTKRELTRFAKTSLLAGDYKAVKIITVKRR